MNPFACQRAACLAQSSPEMQRGASEIIHRIPAKHAPQSTTEAAVLAFYFTKTFGDEKWSIRWHGPVRFVPVAVTFAVLLLPTRGRQVWRIMRAEGWRLPLLGLIGAVLYNVFLGWGETRVAARTASLIIALNPAFTYILSVIFLGKRFTWQRARHDAGRREVRLHHHAGAGLLGHLHRVWQTARGTPSAAAGGRHRDDLRRPVLPGLRSSLAAGSTADLARFLLVVGPLPGVALHRLCLQRLVRRGGANAGRARGGLSTSCPCSPSPSAVGCWTSPSPRPWSLAQLSSSAASG